MELMRRQLCFENNCQTGKFEETTLFAAGRRIYVWIKRGPQLKKKETAKKEKNREDEKGAEGSFHSHMNRRNVSYVQGAKCWGPFMESPVERKAQWWGPQEIDCMNSQKRPLGPSGRNNGLLAQQCIRALKRQTDSKKSGKKEIASHGQNMS